MLMTLTPSRPSRANTTTMTPRMLTSIATQRLLLLCEGTTSALSKNVSLSIGEIQPVLVEVGKTLGFIPDDFNQL